MDEIDREILLFVQDDLPLQSGPYAALAEKLDISEEEICSRLAGHIESGVIRRFGAVLRHGKAGFVANALVVWDVDESRLDEAAAVLAGSDAVSHLYARPVFEGWPYGLYSMIHARDDEELNGLIDTFAGELAGMVNGHKVLRSKREFKKTSMKYFTGEE